MLPQGCTITYATDRRQQLVNDNIDNRSTCTHRRLRPSHRQKLSQHKTDRSTDSTTNKLCQWRTFESTFEKKNNIKAVISNIQLQMQKSRCTARWPLRYLPDNYRLYTHAIPHLCLHSLSYIFAPDSHSLIRSRRPWLLTCRYRICTPRCSSPALCFHSTRSF